MRVLGAGGYLAVGDSTSPTETESFKRTAAYAEVAANIAIALGGLYAVYRALTRHKT